MSEGKSTICGFEPLTSEEIEDLRAIAADESRDATFPKVWREWDGRVLATLDAKDAEIVRLRRELGGEYFGPTTVA